jgi:hypothetical protein
MIYVRIWASTSLPDHSFGENFANRWRHLRLGGIMVSAHEITGVASRS